MRLPLTLALLIPAAMASAQWQLQDAHTTADLRGIDSLGNGVAWASGSNGTVLRTEDAGFVWQLCAIPPNADHLDFRAIQAFDNNTAIVMSSGKGDLSRLYKTTDGCQTWTLLFTNPDKDGFWDALLADRQRGMVLGDAVADKKHFHVFANLDPGPHFPLFGTKDGGEHWERIDDHSLPAWDRPPEPIFAASNSSVLNLSARNELLFATGGQHAWLHSSREFADSITLLPEKKGSSTSIEHVAATGLAVGPTAGGFSIAASSDSIHPTIVITGGDYTRPDSSTGTAATCTFSLNGLAEVLGRWDCYPATTPPHGYRSAVAYDPTHNTWITVGPNGTDISTDDGRNWRAPSNPTPPPATHPTPTSTGTPSPSPSS